MKFYYYQTIMQFRIPVGDDGKMGDPQLLKKWTSAFNGTQHTDKKKTTTTELVADEIEEEIIG